MAEAIQKINEYHNQSTFYGQDATELPSYIPPGFVAMMQSGQDELSDRANDRSAFDTQVGGNHYKDMAIQPTEYIVKNGLNFVEGNIIKYVTRYKLKGGLQDLEKAKHYLEILIELEKSTGVYGS